MTVADETWVKRNLPAGLATAPIATQMMGAAPGAAPSDQAIRHELIEFDSEAPGAAPYRTAAVAAPATTAAAGTGLDQFVDVAWPTGLQPRPAAPPSGSSLPRADALIVTWTMDEGHALSRVLTPGADSRDNWIPYTKNFAALSAKMRVGCPARNYGRLGTYWTSRIGERSVTLFKSDSHMSQDGPTLVNADVWRQIIADTRPRLVITTGTGGGIGPGSMVGDVIISRFLAFDCQREFSNLDGERFVCGVRASHSRLAAARGLFGFNRGFLPPDNPRKPTTYTAQYASHGILTTDFFGFDNDADTYGLQGKGSLSEMGDAVLGMVSKELGDQAPTYVAVRNVSDPQIAAGHLTLPEQAALAANIYKAYGRWSSVCSAIVCWALVAGM
jgi:hypothetical protein